MKEGRLDNVQHGRLAFLPEASGELECADDVVDGSPDGIPCLHVNEQLEVGD